MTFALRVTLIFVSLVTFLFISRKIRNSKVRLEDSIFWLCFAGLLLVLSVFPQLFFVLSDMVGVYTPVNFVFLFFIFILLVICFRMSMRISRADTKIKELTQQLAIEKYERYSGDEERSATFDGARGSSSQGKGFEQV